MSEFKNHFSKKQGSERSFGIIFFLVFLLISLYPLVASGGVRIWSLILAIAFLFISFIRPSFFKLPNYYWIKLGNTLGVVITPIILGFIYVTTILSIGILMKIIGKDLLNLKLSSSKESYWTARKEKIKTMKNQF